ncbi:MAG: cyclase family protein [Xenococcaceae cyanobacterium MO_188.B32]|nr:cyclase family protein [Xenococcaceae cyanobacterium MO_188.B32]
MNESNNWLDTSLTIYSGMPHWPDNPPVSIEPSQCLAHRDVCNVSKLTIGTHTGTHVDGINHFIKGGMGVERMPLEATIGKARVIEIKDPEQIKVAEIEPYDIQAGERILFKTQNSTHALKVE